MAVRASAGVLLLVLLAGQGGGAAAFDLSAECPGNLVTNGGFEQPNTETYPAELRERWTNSKWGWYKSIPGWYTTRSDGTACARVDWCGTCEHYGFRAIEVARSAMAKAPEGQQYAELLPNGTGTYCADLQLQKGARYRLSFFYGRLVTQKSPEGGTHGYGPVTPFDTAADVAIRPAGHVEPSGSKGIWPGDRQGFSVLASVDSKDNWDRTGKQWVRHETTFTAPADSVTLAFINTKRPRDCGSCGSLLDAVCLQKA